MCALYATDSNYHFEFTQEKGSTAPFSSSPESLLVFYLPIQSDFNKIRNQMVNAGFNLVYSHNEYWDKHGCTFEDPEGYRVVLCKNEWTR